ncbi:hypothetical protein N4G70_22540 [Streptomyces sp. ASQP_92]|uniref:hypothetical protein n=1 Tax=Streptomyces sp. ASQP_92 TaxID=2979116 RepID=UPI0021BF73B9|nr:hypothetical protein [Streptomyces sp. ASQP_92]MCT9091627.1 hypothetical protein [Streptomyces sp. ASQP_92]
MPSPTALPPARLIGMDRTGNIPLAARGFALFHGSTTAAPFAIGPLASPRADTSWCPGTLLDPRLVRIANAFVTAEGGK